jgi:transcriptional regulator with XRE-family HTH domain
MRSEPRGSDTVSPMSGRMPPDDPTGEDPIGEGLGRAIRVLRTARDLGRRELAERAGLSYSYLAEIENGDKSPSAKALAALAGALGLALHELVAAAEAWRAPVATADEPLAVPTATARDLALETLGELRDADSSGVPDEDPAAEALVERMRSTLEDRPELAFRSLRSPGSPSRTAAFAAQRLAFPFTGRSRAASPAAVPEALLEEIRGGHCVAFVGAGFARAARLPAWGELLREVARRARLDAALRAHVERRVALGSSSALDEAAQVLEDALGRDALIGALREILGHPEPTDTMRRRLELLRGIPFRSILTTNFDGLLAGEAPGAEAYRRALRPEAYRWWAPRFWSGEGAHALKLHGDLGDPSRAAASVVLTRRDYRRRVHEDAAYATFLRSVMATSTVLYLGFSFEDAYLNELRSEVLALLGQRSESEPLAYAVANDVPPATGDHFRRHEGIEILGYDSDAGRDFSGFDAWLEAIHERTSPLLRFARHLERGRILWVDPHPENNEPAFAHLARAAALAHREGTALVRVASADEGLARIAEAAAGEPFDLAITHWGDGAARDEAGARVSAAERLLAGLRARDLRCPVVVFAAAAPAAEVERRKRAALGLGAIAYCFAFETLYQAIERVLAPAAETG